MPKNGTAPPSTRRRSNSNAANRASNTTTDNSTSKANDHNVTPRGSQRRSTRGTPTPQKRKTRANSTARSKGNKQAEDAPAAAPAPAVDDDVVSPDTSSPVAATTNGTISNNSATTNNNTSTNNNNERTTRSQSGAAASATPPTTTKKTKATKTPKIVAPSSPPRVRQQRHSPRTKRSTTPIQPPSSADVDTAEAESESTPVKEEEIPVPPSSPKLESKKPSRTATAVGPKGGSTIGNDRSMHLSEPKLLTASMDGKTFNVQVMVNALPYVSQQQSNTTGSGGINLGGTDVAFLGQDGNLFHCQNCHGFGDVVCCDGCPHVYHPKCIPHGPSRKSLENDDDPWFCPSCLEKKKTEKKKKKKDAPTVQPSKVKSSSPTPEQPSNSAPDPAVSTAAAAADDDDKDDANIGADENAADTPTVTMKTATTKATNPTGEKRAVKRRCCECHQSSTGGLALEPCEGCGAYLHNPPCQVADEDYQVDNFNVGSVLCSTCRSEMAQSQEEIDFKSDTPTKKRRKGSLDMSVDAKGDAAKDENGDADQYGSSDDEDDDDDDDDEDDTPRRKGKKGHHDDDMSVDSRSRGSGKSTGSLDEDANSTVTPNGSKKRRRQLSVSSEHDALSVSKKKKKKKKKADKKKKKKKHHDEANGDKMHDAEAEAYHDYSVRSSNANGMAQATPAFFFFLGENRFKIERHLARKHRIFNRLPKGMERNELVAKEAAHWWIKLKPSEVRRYIILSMKDYEQRIIEWKEEKNIREMLGEANGVEPSLADEAPKDSFLDMDSIAYYKHMRLYLATTVGSKSFKPEPGISHNRILLELLQDMRFHPVPMFMTKRPNTEYGQMDFSRVTIPFFDVHGPVSTSVGDECLGCTRGWAHICSVLKRRLPAVEHRAKLQPPLSSLVATRVGLGLRFKPLPPETPTETETDARQISSFAVREVPESKGKRYLPVVPWDSLSDPSSRADDVVEFIEEAIAMKISEPPRPVNPTLAKNDSKKVLFKRANLPTRDRKRSADTLTPDGDSGSFAVNKCGRCRTVIQTDTGCIQCRRAQLVINTSKRSGPSNTNLKLSPKNELKDSKRASVQTYMLGRISMKEGSGEMQSEGDTAVANSILKSRWTPWAVLPPTTTQAPIARSQDDNSSDEDDSADESEKSGDDSSSKMDETSANDKADDDSSMLSEPQQEQQQQPEVNGEEDDGSDHSSHADGSTKRTRSTRRVTSGVTPNESSAMSFADRQKIAEKYREEFAEIQKKALTTACCGILLGLMRRDPLQLFAEPVTAEGYTTIVKTPIDFGKIRNNVLQRKYSSLGSFISECRLLCRNALTYNPPGTIYWKTAKELLDVITLMQRRASSWMSAIKDAHKSAVRQLQTAKSAKEGDDNGSEDSTSDTDMFAKLREKWPEAVEMLDNSEWLRDCMQADFMRTKENETAYYGSLAIRRAAVAAEASLAPYPEVGGVFNPVAMRDHLEDDNLRSRIAERVSQYSDPVELKDLPTWREESIIRVMRRAQSRRLEGRVGSENGCARCDGVRIDQELKMAMTAETIRWGRNKKKGEDIARVHRSRIHLSTGMASENALKRIESYREKVAKPDSPEKWNLAKDVTVSVRGSRVHGWGLFADQKFKKGDVVAEYLGEYVSLAVTEAREKIYQEQRIQDYQFRIDDSLVIDATMRGGYGRYINHNCNPNCIAKTVPGTPPNEHLKRVIIIAQHDIKPREELTYDYQFPLELDLEARVPCNCQSEQCRGFMNWDLPEKGSHNRVLRTQKRGANMRDRIRRLGRPLKGDK